MRTNAFTGTLLDVNLQAALDRLDEDPRVRAVTLEGMWHLHSDDRCSFPTPAEWAQLESRFAEVVKEAEETLGAPHVDSKRDGSDVRLGEDVPCFVCWVRDQAWVYVGLFAREGAFDWTAGVEVGRVLDVAWVRQQDVG